MIDRQTQAVVAATTPTPEAMAVAAEDAVAMSLGCTMDWASDAYAAPAPTTFSSLATSSMACPWCSRSSSQLYSPAGYAAYGSTPRSHNITSAPPTPVYNGNQQYVDPALLQALNNMHLPGNQEWFMDIGASSHMSSDHGIISSFKPASQTVMVGNGQSIPATHIGSQIIPLPPDHFLATIFLSFPTLSKTLFLFANSQLTTIVQLNLILLVFP